MANLKELSKHADRLTGGHRLCAGCGAGVVARQTLLAAGDMPVVVVSATGCLEVSTSVYPYSAWKTPFFHSAFENSAATCSGVEAAYKSLVRQGKIADEPIRFVAFGGDGGTYDIGLQSLSGAMERGHRMLYVCYNNEAYMNTGIQRSGATPQGASATTSPVGKVKQGKEQAKKDLTAIIAAHNVPYAAQAIIGNWNDYITKVQKALNTDGATFINVLTPCRLGWGCKPEDSMEMVRLAVDTCIWPVYEVENGKYKMTMKPRGGKKLPVADFFKHQARFKHLLKPNNADLLARIQADVDAKWEKICNLCGEEVIK